MKCLNLFYLGFFMILISISKTKFIYTCTENKTIALTVIMLLYKNRKYYNSLFLMFQYVHIFNSLMMVHTNIQKS